MSNLVRYFWDFFGPASQPTASHFREHLDQFLVREALAGCVTGVGSKGAGHTAVWCTAPESAQAPIERALRPRRRENVEPTDVTP